MNNKTILFLLILIIVILFFLSVVSLKSEISSLNVKNEVKKESNYSNEYLPKKLNDNNNSVKIDLNKYMPKTTNKNNSHSDEYISIPVNQPISFNHMTREQIYNIRKKVVANSIFKNQDYQPSDAVFGRIQDFKPWISIDSCFENGHAKITGPSEEARFIMNPTVLVAIEYVYCSECDLNNPKPAIQPTSIKYSKNKKEIVVTYNKLEEDTLNDNTVYSFRGLNAIDLGYKYVYIDKTKSTYDLIFADKDSNLSTTYYTFTDFIHNGFSCRVPGGCNNGSPYQPMVDFENSHISGTPYKKNKEIYIKFWKLPPNTLQDEPDIVERIIIENA